jgi:hypothetical protein
MRLRSKIEDLNERQFVSQILKQKQEEEDEKAQAEEIAPWLVKPESSTFYKVWTVFIALILQVELIIIPFIMVDREILIACNRLFWALDVFWVINMLVKL